MKIVRAAGLKTQDRSIWAGSCCRVDVHAPSSGPGNSPRGTTSAMSGVDPLARVVLGGAGARRMEKRMRETDQEGLRRRQSGEPKWWKVGLRRPRIKRTPDCGWGIEAAPPTSE